jgi:hypothetical protein
MLHAEYTLAFRVAVRHPVARSAVAWTVGLATIVRIAGGVALPGHLPGAMVALAGVLAAATAPPVFVRGGPFEALSWSRGRLLLAILARLAAVVTISMAGAGATGIVLGGTLAEPALAVGGALAHAVLIGALAATLAPASGCASATVWTLLLVAAGVGVWELESGGAALPVLPPPGALLADPWGGHPLALAGWAGLATLGVLALAARARPVRIREERRDAGV